MCQEHSSTQSSQASNSSGRACSLGVFATRARLRRRAASWEPSETRTHSRQQTKNAQFGPPHRRRGRSSPAGNPLCAKLRAASRSLTEFDAFLQRCIDIPNPAEPHEEIAASIAALLTVEIDAMDPADRPLIVVFIDTFERLSVDPRRYGERLLNQLVHSLPHALFVITGRDSIDWFRNRPELYRFGAEIWPSLIHDRPNMSSQHVLDNLSDRDPLCHAGCSCESEIANNCPSTTRRSIGSWRTLVDCRSIWSWQWSWREVLSATAKRHCQPVR